MNYKQYAKFILSNDNITALTADHKVYYQFADNAAAPYVVYQFYDERNVLSAEGREVVTRYSIQIDIYSKSDYTNLEAVLKETLGAAGWFKRSVFEDYDDKTKLFFKAMRYEFDIIQDPN